MTPTTLALIHFGSDDYRPLLDLWLERFESSGCRLPLVLVTDTQVTVPEKFSIEKGNWIRRDTLSSDRGLQRTGRVFDTKGVLVLHALREIDGPVLTIDADAFLRKDPSELLEKLALSERTMAMGVDPETRPIEGFDSLNEMNAGVVFFGAKRDTKWITALYCQAFRQFRPQNDDALLEQKCWTIVWKTVGGSVLPRSLNWSRRWGESKEVAIFHEHGPGKWDTEPKLRGKKPRNLPEVYLKWRFPSERAVNVVLAHAGTEETCRRHLPYWRRTADRTVFVVPEDQKFDMASELVVRRVKNGGSYSPETSERALDALRIGLETGAPYVWLYEYDSLCWGPMSRDLLPPDGSMGSCLWPNERVSPVPGKTFRAPFYLHFPQLWTASAIRIALSRKWPLEAEHGYTDRFLGMVCHGAGIHVTDWNRMGKAYSQENITSYPNRVERCREAVRKGALFTHGIKHAEGLDRIAGAAPWGR